MEFDVSEQEGYKGTPSENGIMHLIVVGSLLNVQLLEESAGQVVCRFVIPSAIGALCRLVGLLEIGVQVRTLKVLLCNRVLRLFKR